MPGEPEVAISIWPTVINNV